MVVAGHRQGGIVREGRRRRDVSRSIRACREPRRAGPERHRTEGVRADGEGPTRVHPTERRPPRRIPVPILHGIVPHVGPVPRSRRTPMSRGEAGVGEYRDVLQAMQRTEGQPTTGGVASRGYGIAIEAEVSDAVRIGGGGDQVRAP